MSSSPSQRRDTSSPSPCQSPTQMNSSATLVQIVVHSVMEGVKDVKVLIPTDATVYELKRSIAIATDVPTERQLLLYNDTELRENGETLSHYGIDGPSKVTMNVKMHTGILVDRAADFMTFLPLVIPTGVSQRSLRSKIRSMTNIQERRPQKPQPMKNWSAEKQMEHEITRNRMKELLRKRKRTTILSTSPPGDISSPGSVMCRSPEELQFTHDEKAAHTKAVANLEHQMSEKELKVFFEPPESLNELCQNCEKLVLAPENEDQLNKIKAEKAKLDKTTCNFCRQKLSLSDQEIRCYCNNVFCKRHRDPSKHCCPIDYRITGRNQLMKNNPKVEQEQGCAHKADIVG